MASLRVGDEAPDFTLPAVGPSGASVTLSSFRGKKSVVLFFYPGDDTPVCTREACEFRDGYARFVEAGAEVLGVSGDSLDSHTRFAQKHGLPMTLLTDAGGEVAARYGVRGLLGLVPGRTTFVIDRAGRIRSVYDSALRASKHVETALEALRGL